MRSAALCLELSEWEACKYVKLIYIEQTSTNQLTEITAFHKAKPLFLTYTPKNLTMRSLVRNWGILSLILRTQVRCVLGHATNSSKPEEQTREQEKNVYEETMEHIIDEATL